MSTLGRSSLKNRKFSIFLNCCPLRHIFKHSANVNEPYRTFFGGNLDFPKIKKLKKVCSDVWTCTKMSRQCYFQQNNSLKLLITFKMAYSCCFSLGGHSMRQSHQIQLRVVPGWGIADIVIFGEVILLIKPLLLADLDFRDRDVFLPMVRPVKLSLRKKYKTYRFNKFKTNSNNCVS